MNKKGFTLVELLAVFILLGIIAVIAFKVTDDLKEQSQIEALKVSAKNLFTAADNYYADNDYKNFPKNGISIKDLDIQGTSFTSGRVKLDSNDKFLLVNVTDGEYCINGGIDNLNIKNEVCVGTGDSPLEGATKAYILVTDSDDNVISPTNFPDELSTPSGYSGAIIYVNSEGKIIDFSNGTFLVTKVTDEVAINTFIANLEEEAQGLTYPVEIHSYTDTDLGFSYIFMSGCDLKTNGSNLMTEEEYQNYCVNNLTFFEIFGPTITDEFLISGGYTIINF